MGIWYFSADVETEVRVILDRVVPDSHGRHATDSYHLLEQNRLKNRIQMLRDIFQKKWGPKLDGIFYRPHEVSLGNNMTSRPRDI